MKNMMIAAAIAASLVAAGPAQAQSQGKRLTERELAVLRAQVRDGQAVQRSLDDRNAALNRAAKAAEVGDKVLRAAANRAAPGLGAAAYDGGKRIGTAAFNAIKKVGK